MTSELVVSQWLCARLDEHALHGAPPVVLIGGVHAMHLSLSADGVAVLFAGDAQKHVRACVFEAHCLVPVPVDAVALHRPHVQIVALAILAKSAHLLVIGQRGAEVVRVQVSARFHVSDPNRLATLYGCAALTWTVGLPSDLPVTVGVVCSIHPGHGLLSTA